MGKLTTYNEIVDRKPEKKSINETKEAVLAHDMFTHPEGPENHPDWKIMLGNRTAAQAFLKLSMTMDKKLTPAQNAALEKVKERLVN